MSQKFNGQYPFDEYIVYVVYHSKEKRRYAILYPIDKNKKMRSMSYARYLMSVKEGRILHKEEQVDHIDNDSMNDDINNLQILTPQENRMKYAKTVTKAYVTLKCPICGKIFTKDKNHVSIFYSNAKFTACSHECASKLVYLRTHNKLSAEELNSLASNNIVREFRI